MLRSSRSQSTTLINIDKNKKRPNGRFLLKTYFCGTIFIDIETIKGSKNEKSRLYET